MTKKEEDFLDKFGEYVRWSAKGEEIIADLLTAFAEYLHEKGVKKGTDLHSAWKGRMKEMAESRGQSQKRGSDRDGSG